MRRSKKLGTRYISVLLDPGTKAKLKEMARALEDEHKTRFNIGNVAAKIITQHMEEK